MSDTPTQANAKTAVSSLVIELAREQSDSSRTNSGLTASEYALRDSLANGPKQAGSNGVLKGADDALETDSPYSDSTAIGTAVP